MAKYVLEFISGRYQGGEFPLEMDSEIVIGRSSELDMVLVEDMVSNRHARITSFDDEILVEDLSSIHGTFVNGERVTRARLEEGDRILIGTHIIKLCAESTASSRASSAPTSGYQPGMVAGRPVAPGSTEIDTNEVPLHDLLDLFASSRRTTVLSYQGHDSVKIYVKAGRIHWVTYQDEADPHVAFARILALGGTRWRMDSWGGDAVTAQPLDATMEEFVEEVNRRLRAMATISGD